MSRIIKKTIAMLIVLILLYANLAGTAFGIISYALEENMNVVDNSSQDVVDNSQSDIIEEDTIKSIVKKDCSRVSIIGHGMNRNFKAIKKAIDIIEKEKLEILEFNISSTKLTIIFKDVVNDNILNKFHKRILEADLK